MTSIYRTGAHALCALFVFAGSASAQVFGVELIQNRGAEDGPASPDGYAPVANIPGWTFFNGVNVVRYATGGEFPGTGAPGSPARGAQFFSGGSNSPFSTASQTIDVVVGAAQIDSGLATYDVRGWLGGAGSQDDTAQLAAIFNDSNGLSIGTATVPGPFASERGNTTGMVERSATGPVPAGTRSITVILTMIRTSGNYNNGYADSLSLRLDAPPLCDGDVNCDGNLDGFDVEVMERATGGDMADYCQIDPDFNRDGNLDGFDVEAVERVVGGGPCP